MSTTLQPIWKFIANLGDIHPLDYGGYFVYEDETGVYPAEAELIETKSDEAYDDNETYTVHRFILDRCTFVDGILSDNKFHPEHPAWFASHITGIASYIGSNVDELYTMLCSESAVDRAFAYRSIGEHSGFENLDSYPLTMTRAEAKRRYTKGELGS